MTGQRVHSSIICQLSRSPVRPVNDAGNKERILTSVPGWQTDVSKSAFWLC